MGAFGFSKRATRSFRPPQTRLRAFPTPRPGPRPRRRRASRGPRGPTAEGFLARVTPSTRHGGRGWRGFGGCSCIHTSRYGFFFAFLLDHHFFGFQMSVYARRHRLNMCLGGLAGYDVIAHATSLLHTQKVASSSLASSTFFFIFLPPPCP